MQNTDIPNKEVYSSPLPPPRNHAGCKGDICLSGHPYILLTYFELAPCGYPGNALQLTLLTAYKEAAV